MSETPLTAIGDEAIEARIVAWVLGEASAFEVAELERLCAERPELMIFHRRMTALHGLIGEAEGTKEDLLWKLPPSKRVVLLDQIDSDSTLPETFKESRVRRSAMRSILSIAACLLFTVIILGLAAPMAIRQRKKASFTADRSMAMQRELQALEEAEASDAVVVYQEKTLRADISRERIEGTPKPRVMPGEMALNDRARQNESLAKKAKDWSNSPFTTAPPAASPPAQEYLAQGEKGASVPGAPSAPSKPSSSMSKVIASSGTAITIPVPDVDVATPSLDFGDGNEFGQGLEMDRSALAANEKHATQPAPSAAPASRAVMDEIALSNESIPVPTNSFQKLKDVSDFEMPARDSGPERLDIAKKSESETTADPFADVDASISHLSARRALDMGGSGPPALPAGGVPSEELAHATSMGNRSGDRTVERGNIDAILDDTGGFTKSGSGTVTLSGDNTYSGGTTVSSGTLGIGGPASEIQSSRGEEIQPGSMSIDYVLSDPGKGDRKSDLSQPDEAQKPSFAYEDRSWEEKEGKSLEFHTRYTSEYFFKGMDLGKDKAVIPNDSDALTKAIREQEDKVDERRKVLSTIVRTKGITYNWKDSSEDKGARSALNLYNTLEQQKVQLDSQISSLDKYGSDQLMAYASGLDLPDNAIRALYPQYQQANRQLEIYRSKGLGQDHPTMKSAVEQTEQMKRQLDEGVANLEATLKAQRDLVANRLKQVEVMKDESRESMIRQGLDTQDYIDAKSAFEKEQALLEAMKSKISKLKEPEPKPDLTQLIEEISAAEDPYSTFSLNISDASFRIAQAAMAKGEQPDPAGVKVEQFYNAVDYGDPAPAAGEPVACTIDQAAHPVIPGRNLVRVSLKTAAAGRSAAQPLRLTLLVDQSGSMSRADRREAMASAMRSLGTLLTDKDLVTVIGFSRTSRLLAVDMKGNEVGEKLTGLVNQSASEGGTNLEEAIKLAEQKALSQKLVGAQNRIVLFTDGAANLGDADPQRLAAKVEQLRQQGIAFDIAGIAADDINDELLGELARKGNGRYSIVGKGEEQDFAKQLAGAFRPAAENVKVQVRFNPERVSRYKLIGFEKDRLKTEDFRNDAVDAAELAAEEAGVAIYQVETLPDGRGEIGEVSVRFRDTARGEMVERMWTMTHNTSAPAIDQAAPSMQLATLALLAGEKLKGGPLAEAIDFKQLAEPQATVKQAYGHNTRVAELLHMVDALK